MLPLHYLRASFISTLLTLFLLPAGAQAVTNFTFEGTSAKGVDVTFTADLTIAGDLLTLVLTNDSLESLNPDDVLTSFYFDIFDGATRPTLTWDSATGNVYNGVDGGADTLAIAGADLTTTADQGGVSLTHVWDFRDDIAMTPGTEPLTFGVGAAGNNTLSPNGFNGMLTDGVDQGIYAGDVSTANLQFQLVKGLATFQFSGLTGFTEADITDEVLFGLGTKPDSTGFVPEPGTALLMGMGLIGLASIKRRS
jgi:hypothetical protein